MGHARLSAFLVSFGLVAGAACTIRDTPDPPTTTAVPTTTTTMGHDHGASDEAPYLSPDDPRLTPEQRQRARDLIARTEEAMKQFPDQASVVRAGYVSILDASSGYEHFFNHAYLQDGRALDPQRIEAIVLEAEPGRPKRVVAAVYILDRGSTMADVPDVAGPLTVWHNHKDLCWDPSGRFVIGVHRLGRCIPAGTVQELPPMLHVWVVPNECGPFAEVPDHGLVDRLLQDAGLLPPPEPPADGCAHVQHGDHTTGGSPPPG